MPLARDCDSPELVRVPIGQFEEARDHPEVILSVCGAKTDLTIQSLVTQQ
jgi:hypothetical protein